MSAQSILAECGFKDADEVRRVAAANQLPPDRRPPECDLRGCRFVRLIKREEDQCSPPRTARSWRCG